MADAAARLQGARDSWDYNQGTADFLKLVSKLVFLETDDPHLSNCPEQQGSCWKPNSRQPEQEEVKRQIHSEETIRLQSAMLRHHWHPAGVLAAPRNWNTGRRTVRPCH